MKSKVFTFPRIIFANPNHANQMNAPNKYCKCEKLDYTNDAMNFQELSKCVKDGILEACPRVRQIYIMNAGGHELTSEIDDPRVAFQQPYGSQSKEGWRDIALANIDRHVSGSVYSYIQKGDELENIDSLETELRNQYFENPASKIYDYAPPFPSTDPRARRW